MCIVDINLVTLIKGHVGILACICFIRHKFKFVIVTFKSHAVNRPHVSINIYLHVIYRPSVSRNATEPPKVKRAEMPTTSGGKRRKTTHVTVTSPLVAS